MDPLGSFAGGRAVAATSPKRYSQGKLPAGGAPCLALLGGPAIVQVARSVSFLPPWAKQSQHMGRCPLSDMYNSAFEMTKLHPPTQMCMHVSVAKSVSQLASVPPPATAEQSRQLPTRSLDRTRKKSHCASRSTTLASRFNSGFKSRNHRARVTASLFASATAVLAIIMTLSRPNPASPHGQGEAKCKPTGSPSAAQYLVGVLCWLVWAVGTWPAPRRQRLAVQS